MVVIDVLLFFGRRGNDRHRLPVHITGDGGLFHEFDETSFGEGNADGLGSGRCIQPTKDHQLGLHLAEIVIYVIGAGSGKKHQHGNDKSFHALRMSLCNRWKGRKEEG